VWNGPPKQSEDRHCKKQHDHRVDQMAVARKAERQVVCAGKNERVGSQRNGKGVTPDEKEYSARQAGECAREIKEQNIAKPDGLIGEKVTDGRCSAARPQADEAAGDEFALMRRMRKNVGCGFRILFLHIGDFAHLYVAVAFGFFTNRVLFTLPDHMGLRVVAYPEL
jgi:hypothetical protein